MKNLLCDGNCVTPEPYWKFCPVCGLQLDPNLMDLITRVIEKQERMTAINRLESEWDK